MAFGIYIHIPYCLQRCIYCDFATFEISSRAAQILPPIQYVDRAKKEIRAKGPLIGPKEIDTLYFGGGTPSLLEAEDLISLVRTLDEVGFPLKKDAEVTLEINPATLDEKKIGVLVENGFNRFSVGAQTFDEKLLKMTHRKHSAQDTVDTLSLLSRSRLNYSLDLLFALPTQTSEGLKADLEKAMEFEPPHVSPYCLTVPESNPLYWNRPDDDTQISFFEMIREFLVRSGFSRYEISNFARPGFESRHNLLYWNDDEYWGLGLSSHSYLHRGEWGVRFWNPRSLADYENHLAQMGAWSPENLDPDGGEELLEHQALTDYFHTSLRKSQGLNKKNFLQKFKKDLKIVAGPSLEKLVVEGLVSENNEFFCLTERGVLLSNQVFRELTFLPDAH